MRGEGGRRPPGVVSVPLLHRCRSLRSALRPTGLGGGYLALGGVSLGGGRRERRAEEARAVVLRGAVLLAGVRFAAVSLAGVRFGAVSFAGTLCSGGPFVSICSVGAATGEACDSSWCAGRPATVGSGCVSGSFSTVTGSGVALRAECEPCVNHRAGAGGVGGSPERGRELSGGMEADLLIPLVTGTRLTDALIVQSG
jgi:hypothetical protein